MTAESLVEFLPQDVGVALPQAPRLPTWRRWYVAGVGSVDIIAALVASGAATLVTKAPPVAVARSSWHLLFVGLPVGWMAALRLAGAHDKRAVGLGLDEYRRVVRGATGFITAMALLTFGWEVEPGRRYILVAVLLCAGLSLLGRYAARRALYGLRRYGRCLDRVLAVGSASDVLDLDRRMRREPQHGLRLVGACLSGSDARSHSLPPELPVLGDLQAVAATARAAKANAVTVAPGAKLAGLELRQLAWELEGTGTDLVLAPGLTEVAESRLRIRPVAGLPLIHLRQPALSGGLRTMKTLGDRLGAAVALVLLLPLLAVVATAIRLTSNGPVIFRQTRIGRDGQQFTLWKFRTMVRDAESRRAELAHLNECSEGLLFKIRYDPRVTLLGKRLRRWSLDELPQLVNVLAGHMSLVGPRPPLPEEVAAYDDDVRRRLLVKPGLTGLWQVSGRSDLTWEDSVRLDLAYVENWSPGLDLLILWKTASAVFRGSGAC